MKNDLYYLLPIAHLKFPVGLGNAFNREFQV